MERAEEIARLADADTLVELGSGTSDKTRIVLDAMASGRLQRYVPFDVAASTLRTAAEAVADEYPGVLIEGVVGDFRRHLGAIPGGWPAAVRLPRRHDRQPRRRRTGGRSSPR